LLERDAAGADVLADHGVDWHWALICNPQQALDATTRSSAPIEFDITRPHEQKRLVAQRLG
jgi:hypothetical protein